MTEDDMKSLITQFYIHPSKLTGEIGKMLSDLPDKSGFLEDCSKSVKAYAHSVGADYLRIEDPVNPERHPACERLRILTDPIFRDYDQILYLDMDVKVVGSNSVFEYAEPGTLVVSDRWYSEPTQQEFYKSKAIRNAHSFFTKFTSKEEADKIVNYEFNSGVMMFSSDILNVMGEKIDWNRLAICSFQDQIELNYVTYLCAEAGELKYKKISKHWNELRHNMNTQFWHRKGALATKWNYGKLT